MAHTPNPYSAPEVRRAIQKNNELNDLHFGPNGLLIGANVQDLALTTGRVVIVGANHILSDSANLTFDGTSLTSKRFIVNTNGQSIPINSFTPVGSEGNNILIGGGGANAVYVSTTFDGTYNVSLGTNALQSVTTGHRNLAVGYSAMQLATTAQDNFALGYFSLGKNVDGINNVAIGTISLRESTHGSDNVALGYGSLLLNVTGTNNVAIGTVALERNLGSGSIGIGAISGYYSTTSNQLFIDSDPNGRNSEAQEKTDSLIYGVFDPVVVNQILTFNGRTGIHIPPTAWFTLCAGSATAGTAPIKMTSGVSLTAAEVGAIEFTTDNLYFTITTGAARKNITLDEGLTSGRVPYVTTNGRLTDSSNIRYDGTNVILSGLKYPNADGSLGSLLQTDGSGNLSWISPQLFNYGSMYADNISQSVTISVADTPVQVGGGLTGGLTNNFTFQNSRELKCLVAGKYVVNWAMSVQSATASQEIEGGIMVGGTAQPNGNSHTETGNAGGSRPDTICGTAILNLAANDLVSLYVANHTAVHNIVVVHASLTIASVVGLKGDKGDTGSIPVTQDTFFNAPVADPLGTNSINPTYKMMGLGSSWVYTPILTGKLKITFSGFLRCGSSTGSRTRLVYGTGAAPANGAAYTGTQIGIDTIALTVIDHITRVFIVSGLTLNTQYWFDLPLCVNTTGAGTLNAFSIVIEEIFR